MTTAIPGNIPEDQLLALYRRMLLIRRTEERLSADFKAGRLPGPVHLCIGQEAVPVGVCAHLGDADWIASTHRGHGHFLAKGGDPVNFMAEVYGRASGICGGKGGSMHVADFSRGILGANGIVGGGIGLSTGAALAAQLDGAGGVAVAFFGDGAANQGVLAEALNIATLWKLPLILVCENNGFSEFSLAEDVTAGVLTERAAAYGLPAVAADGNDVLDMLRAAGNAVARARAGEGPSFIEARTYRFHGHVESEASFLTIPYRTDEEIEQRRARDPVETFAARLQEGIAGEDRLAAIDAEILDTIERAAEAAEAAPWPAPETAHRDMFA